jgi:hypothetical protein
LVSIHVLATFERPRKSAAIFPIMFRTNFIPLNLSEGSPRKGNGATGSRGAVWWRAGIGPVQNPLDGDQAVSSVTASDQLDRGVGISRPHRFGIVGNCFSGKAIIKRIFLVFSGV